MSDFYKVITPATEAPVTLAEASSWLKDLPSADNDLVEDLLIPTAVRKGERYTGRVFITRTIEAYFDSLRVTNCEPFQFVQVNRAPMIAISSVETYVDGDYAAFTDFVLKETPTYSRVLFENGITGADSNAIYPVKITFTVGYGDADAITASESQLKTAILEHVAFLYENRGDTEPESKIGIPLQIQSLYSDYRILTVFG